MGFAKRRAFSGAFAASRRARARRRARRDAVTIARTTRSTRSSARVDRSRDARARRDLSNSTNRIRREFDANSTTRGEREGARDMGCAQGTLKRAGSVKARDRSLAVMKSLFPVAFVDAYEVESKATFDAYGGAFDVVSREDGSARTAVLARLKKQADGECLTISQFSMEEYVLQLLRHDGVASVYESFTELRKRPAMGVLIVDRLRGAKLIDYLQQKDGAKLGEDEAREIMVQLASVLKHLVDCGVTCGNLDLDTLVFREEDNMELVVTSMRYASLAGHPSPYVVEYGTYEIEDELGQPVTRTFPEDARKLHFAAPERLKPDSRGRDRQASVDVWSFGVIMYTLLAGYLPFEGEDSRTLCEKIRSRQLHRLQVRRRHVGPHQHGRQRLDRGMSARRPSTSFQHRAHPQAPVD